MQRREAHGQAMNPRRSAQLLLPLGTFALVDAAALNAVFWIRRSSISWSWTGFYGTDWHFSWGYDAIWFPAFLVLTGFAFFLPARTRGLLPGRRLLGCTACFTVIRFLAAYSWWCSFTLFKPLLQRFGPASGFWPPGGMPSLSGVLVFEISLVGLCAWLFSLRRERSSAQPAGADHPQQQVPGQQPAHR